MCLVVVNSISVEGRVQICENYGYMVLVVMICWKKIKVFLFLCS